MDTALRSSGGIEAQRASLGLAGICTVVILMGGVGLPAQAQQATAAAASDRSQVAQLRRRVEQLEEQLVDIQVTLGTLESLARAGGGSGATPGGLSGSDAGRIAALETQVRALTAQLQQQSRPSAGGGGSTPNTDGNGWRAGNATQPFATPPSTTGFGSTTVQPSAQPGIGNFIRRDQQQRAAVERAPFASAGDAQADYETAYGLLLQQNYGGAGQAFSEFVKSYPRHALAGNAQYWLGETYYVQGDYKNAAGAFLTGYRTYKSSAKAPDSLLKLALSLDRLGQRAAACSSLNELGAKYPQAPQHVKRRVDQERRRLRC